MIGPPPPSLFSTSIGQYTQQQTSVPGVRISVNELRSTTRFNDLHEELQKAIEYVDNFILNKIQWKEACDTGAKDIENRFPSIPPDVEVCSKQLETLQSALENDAESIQNVKNLVKADAADAKLSFKTIQSLKVPQQYQQTSIWASSAQPQTVVSRSTDSMVEEGTNRNIVEYFSNETDNMTKTLETCKRSLDEIELYLKGLESNIAQQSQQMAGMRGQDDLNVRAENQVRDLAAVLRAFENGILGVAAKVGATREATQDIMLGPGDLAMQRKHSRRFGTQ